MKHILKTFLTLCIGSFLFFSSAYSSEPQVLIVEIKDNPITPVIAEYIASSIDTAGSRNAEVLVIRLDTPGGLLASSRTIVKDILAADVPVCVYVSPRGARAGSAGVFITYASHIAAMAPSTNIGAAHPVRPGSDERKGLRDKAEDLLRRRDLSGPEDPATEDEAENKNDTTILGEKVLQDTVAFITTLAKKRGRNIEWARASVVESASITEFEALEMNVIELIAENDTDLLNKLHGREITLPGRKVTLQTKNAEVTTLPMSIRQRFLNTIADPNIAYMLLMLGFFGILFEITNPGIGLPGTAGAIFLILAFFGMQTLPTNYAGLALIALGIILFIAETQIPGFGLPSLGGLISMFLGSVMLFESPDNVMRVSLFLAAGFSAGTGLITVILINAVLKTHRKRTNSGREALTGKEGVAYKEISPDGIGKIRIHGEIWNARAEEHIGVGEKVIVTGTKGLLLNVKKNEPRG